MLTYVYGYSLMYMCYNSRFEISSSSSSVSCMHMVLYIFMYVHKYICDVVCV